MDSIGKNIINFLMDAIDKIKDDFKEYLTND